MEHVGARFVVGTEEHGDIIAAARVCQQRLLAACGGIGVEVFGIKRTDDLQERGVFAHDDGRSGGLFGLHTDGGQMGQHTA